MKAGVDSWRSEIDAAAVSFPVAEARGLRASRAATFHGGAMRRLPADCAALAGGGRVAAAESRVGSTSEGAFGTGANSARIAHVRPHETPAKTKMSAPAGIDLSSGTAGARRAFLPRRRRGALSARASFPRTSKSSRKAPARSRASTILKAASLRCSPLVHAAPASCLRFCRASSPRESRNAWANTCCAPRFASPTNRRPGACSARTGTRRRPVHAPADSLGSAAAVANPCRG